MVVLIQGRPGSGKTTLVKRVLERLDIPYTGFFTEEIREKGVRKGFRIVTASGKEAILAHIDSKSSKRVSKYGVEIENIERVAVPSLKGEGLVVIDEIGKMELMSRKFKETLKEIFEKKRKVLGTIPICRIRFIDDLISKYRPVVIRLDRKDSEEVLERVLTLLKK